MILSTKLPRYIDIAFCIVLLPAMILLLPIDRWLTHNSIFVYVLIGWLYGIYIVNRSVTIPMLSQKRGIVVPILIIIVMVAVTYLLTCYQLELPFGKKTLVGEFPGNKISHIPRFQRPMPTLPAIRLQKQGVWMLFTIVMTFSFAVGLLTKLYSEISKRQLVEIAKQKAELALYKAQINPHFLFNSLNALYGMVIKKSDQTEDAFAHFLSFMKYMYENNRSDSIKLETEIDYLEQYIDFQRYRLPEYAKVNYKCVHGDIDDLKIAPMILITFVENVFKHGISACEPTESFIFIGVENGVLSLMTINASLNLNNVKQSKGIGISNCRNRLDLLYPDRYSLEIDESEKNYTVRLTIDLNK